MSDRWNDDQTRNEDRRYGRFGRYGAEANHGPAYSEEAARGSEGRSFSPRREYERDYTGPRYGAGGYTGYGDRGYGEYSTGSRGEAGGPFGDDGAYGETYGRGGTYGDPRDYGGRGYRGQRAQTYGGAGYGRDGGRFYGDDGRDRLFREEYGESSTQQARYDQAFQNPGEGHSEFGFGLGGDRRPYRSERDRGDDAAWAAFGGNAYRGGGEHRGRGPQGYRRSDDRINEDVHDRLTEDPHLDASRITVVVKDAEVTLSGAVGSRHDKHHAEHLVEQVSGVNHVQNNLRVAERTQAAQPHTDASAPMGENTKLSQQAAGKA